MRYRVNTLKYAAGLFTSIGCIFLFFLAAVSRAWLSALFFLAAAAVFLLITVLYGAIVTIDIDGIHRSFWHIPMQEIRWEQVKEVGVVGTRVFNNNDPKHTGTRYLYFSLRCMDDHARFRLALEWPPKEMLYLQYSRERLDVVRQFWFGPVESYNAGDLFFE